MIRTTIFDAFPYIMTRVVSALYHVILLPADLTDDTLLKLAQAQVNANCLPTCLVTSTHFAVYFGIDGKPLPTDQPPRGGILISGKLEPPYDLPDTRELRVRHVRLRARIKKNPQQDGFLFGDLTKGGHAASRAELRRLAGTNEDGSPRGLQRCATCHDWCGVCLDPSENFRGQVMTVHCRCANHNRCARCGTPLYERRLNANYYDAKGNGIWHVPGFKGLSHVCLDRHVRVDVRNERKPRPAPARLI